MSMSMQHWLNKWIEIQKDSILKSPVILIIWLALKSLIKYHHFIFFCIKPHIFPNQRESFLMTKMQQSIRIQGLFKVTNQFVGEWLKPFVGSLLDQ